MGSYAFPAQGANDKTAGVQFSASTVGYQNIVVTFDQRHSNTSVRHVQFQYTVDISAASPVWVDFAISQGTAGDTWFARSYNLSAISGLNNNAHAGFRVVATFAPGTSTYIASDNAGTYAPTGNWRFDMVTVKGTSTGADVNPPVAQSFQITSSTGSYVTFNEAVTSATATNVANYVLILE
jgi:hypothetical protein